MSLKTKESEWELLYVLPNLGLTEPFDTEYISIVPNDDKRIDEIISKHPAPKALLSRFRSIYGHNIEPSAIIRRIDFPEILRKYDHILSFRNLFAISSLVLAWTNRNRDSQMLSPAYSDYFDFYPVQPNDDGKYLIIRSGAFGSSIIPDQFEGQSLPYISNTLFSPHPDADLIKSLLSLWQDTINRGTESKDYFKLFRSLEIAYMALSVPGTAEMTLNEFGLRISLWISAFETIFHPGGGKQVNFSTVSDELFKYPLYRDELRSISYKLRRIEKSKKKGNLCQALYGELYEARNDFLHGEEFNINGLFSKFGDNNIPLLTIAPILYRAALCVFLNIDWPTSARIKIASERIFAVALWEKYENALYHVLDPNNVDNEI